MTTTSAARPLPRLLLAALLVSAVPGCAKHVTRIDPNSVTDLSGRWNDTDSRLVANALIQQTLSGAWVREYSAAHGGVAPSVIVGAVRNTTMEHIPVQTFVRELENALVSSGTVRVVASAAERQEVRAERTDQQENARADTRVKLAQEQGARYMLQGDIQSIEDAEGREKVVYYQVDATLIDLESNAKVWVGQHRIKKYIERPRLRF